jgi:hypothetical protein
MADPILTPVQRRTVTWGLIVIVLALVAVGGIAMVRGVAGAFAIGRRAEPRVSQEIVVEQLRSVAKLVATEMTLRDVVTYEQTQFHSTKRSLLVVTARVSAGIDLSKDTEISIDSTAKRIIVSLPPAQIMSVDVVNVTTYDERAGLWNPFRPADRDSIHSLVRRQMETAARQSGILEHADQSAVKVLTELLSRDGYTVEVRRPPVVGRPTG